MRKITTHKGNELDDALTIRVWDEPSHGGACHRYKIEVSGRNFVDFYDLKFQEGPVKEYGVNGISIESLLAVCIDRLEGFQSGAYASRYNEVALLHLQNALGSLQARTKNRQERGAEGTSKTMTNPTRYQSKVVEIEAIKWDGTVINGHAIEKWSEQATVCRSYIPENYGGDGATLPLGIFIKTLEGEMRADPGDYIVKGPEGEFYPVKPSIFEKKYEVLGSPRTKTFTFQECVHAWMQECFGPEISADTVERNYRFIEEALELVQSLGCTRSEAKQLVDYVYDRPVGDPKQEVGGVMVTLAALCLANGFDMHASGDIELNRIWGKIDAIRAKQAAKPKHSPLPQEVNQ